MRKVLIRFNHGLGDAVQLTSVLAHLRQYRPDWELYLWALRGKHSVGFGHCRQVWHDQENTPAGGDFDEVFDLPWWECSEWYTDSPSTKACKCLCEVFDIRPDPALCTYQVQTREQTVQRARAYLESIGCAATAGRYNAVAIHYEGNTSAHRKNLSHADARALCDLVRDLGHIPVLLDWDSRSPLPNQQTIFNPGVGEGDLWGYFGSGDAEQLAALIAQCALFVGIDSGPQKCAGATATPTLAVWTGHHPLHYFDLDRGNVLHIITDSWRDGLPEGAAEFFQQHYRYLTYPGKQVMEAVLTETQRRLQPAGMVGVAPPTSFVVGIPTLNRYDLLENCIASLFAGDARPTRVVVLDNGGKYRTDRPHVDVIRPSRNLGVASSWNLLFKLAAPLPLVLLNDDVEVGADTLAAVLASPADCAMAAGFSCFRLTHEAYAATGPFDEAFFPAYFEDNDYAHRLRLGGKVILDVAHAGVRHLGSATINSMGPGERANFNASWNRSRNYYLRKWGGLPDHETRAAPFDGMTAGKESVAALRAARFALACLSPSDINEHLDYLRELASQCAHVTELGVGAGNSTLAFLHAQPRKLVSVDLHLKDKVYALRPLAEKTEFVLIPADDLEVEIEDTDLLFIDTWHTYDQLSRELTRHGAKARRWIVLHDTTTFAERGEDGQPHGLWPAVEEFVAAGGWTIKERRTNNNGLTVLERA